MTSPIQLLKEGILNQDWDSVRRAYQALTGESLRSEPEPEPTPAPVKSRNDDDKFRMPPPRRTTQAGEKGKVMCRTLPFEPGMQHEWRDDGTVASEDIADSKALSAKKAPEKRRPPAHLVHVTCSKCGEEDDVPPLLANCSIEGEPMYVCNSCIRSAKRKVR